MVHTCYSYANSSRRGEEDTGAQRRQIAELRMIESRKLTTVSGLSSHDKCSQFTKKRAAPGRISLVSQVIERKKYTVLYKML